MKEICVASLLIMWLVGCTIVTMRPTPVGRSSPAEGDTYVPTTSAAPRPIPTTSPGLRGVILFPRYYNLNLPHDAVAEVWIDGVLVGRVSADRQMVYKIAPGTHDLLARFYEPERQRYGSREQQEEVYHGCSSDRFEVNPGTLPNPYGIFWQLNLPPPSPMCS